jgi:hypothetical protein
MLRLANDSTTPMGVPANAGAPRPAFGTWDRARQVPSSACSCFYPSRAIVLDLQFSFCYRVLNPPEEILPGSLFPLIMLTEPDIHANAKFWLDVADAIVKFIALLVGAAWALMNYLRGRTYKRKLELGIIGKLFRRNGKLYLSILCRLKNVGLAMYPIQQEGSACQIYAFMGLKPELVRTYPVFTDHGWIEPGEQIEHPLMVRIAVDESKLVGLQIKLIILSGTIVWTSSSIIEFPDPEQPATAK